MNEQITTELSRRAFLGKTAGGLGGVALSCLLRQDALTKPSLPHFAPKAKRVIYMFMSGGPSQVDTFDPKPLLNRLEGKTMPASIIKNHQFAMIKTKNPTVKGSPWKFQNHGQSGIEISELFPQVSKVADELAVVRSLHTDSFNHDPAVMFLNTGDVRFGRPSFGAWTSYGLGTENADLPAYVVLVSGKNIQPLLDSYWGAGFLPAEYQGTPFRSQGEPVLYLKNPKGITSETRRDQIDLIRSLNERHQENVNDPEIAARIKQYELAYRMQSSVPGLMAIKRETSATLEAYGAKLGATSLANNCLLARKLVEKGVRFVQLFDQGWDHHSGIFASIPKKARELDRPVAALIGDLRERGLLDETLIVIGAEFGRTPMLQDKSNGDTANNVGRDHHKEAYSMVLAGGGVKGGISHGRTDEFGYRPVENPVHIHDLNATILHLLGLNHEQLTYKVQGRHFRLTDVHGEVVKGILA